MFKLLDTIYDVHYTKKFKKQFKKSLKRGKDEKKFLEVLKYISNGDEIPSKYNNHMLNDNKDYKDCYECHIEPDWLLVYKIQEDKLILLLFAIGSHSDLF